MTTRQRPRTWIPAFTCLAFALAACVLLVGLDGWRTYQAREATIAEDFGNTTNLARSLAQHAHDTLKFADILLVDLRDNLEGGGWDARQIALLQRGAVAGVANLPPIHGVIVYDATGKWVVNSLMTPPGTLSATNQDYFKYHQSHGDRELRVGAPLPCRVTKDCSFVVPLSRRVDAPDGSFAGVVLATVAVDYLKGFYRTFETGRDGIIGLLQTDGHVVVRVGPTETPPGTDVSRGNIWGLVKQSPVGVFAERFPVDRMMRLGSYRKVDDFPLIVVVAHGLDDVLAGWQRDAWLHLGISIGVAVAVAILGVRLARQIKHRQQAECRYRLLADNSSDAIVCVGLDGRRLYVSPAHATLTGRSVEDSIGQPTESAIHPDDRKRVTDDLRTLRKRFADEVTHQFRYLRDDGSVLWVEARARFVAAGNGQPAQIIANLRDISERKAAEERIVALNLELGKQALTDGLTGLSNRRRFDEALAAEWRRAIRTDEMLSLLLIDVDRFKLYNDHFGHQQGDRALRLVAAAVSGVCRRPGEVAARYGGEEMALLLPATDCEGAAACAEALRAAVQALALEHPGNPAVPVLTVSVGVATSQPARDVGSTPEALIGAADAALYEAKRGGRNCVRPAAPPCWDLTRLMPAPGLTVETY